MNSSLIHTHPLVAGGTAHTWPGLTHKHLSLVSLPRAKEKKTTHEKVRIIFLKKPKPYK